MPIGYSKLDLRYTDSQYSRLSTSKFGEYESTGNSQLYSAKLSQVVMRDKTEKLTLSAALEHKNNANYIEGSRLGVSSRPYTSAAYGIEHVTRLLGGSLYSDLTYSRGLSYLGGDHAAYGDNRVPRHFQKLEANSAWARSFTLAGRSLSFNSRLGALYSRDNMLNAERLALGDEYTVRGFRNSPLWGDQGLYSTSTLNMPFSVVGGTVSPLLGLDAGWVRDLADSSKSERIAGFALGVTGNWRYGGGSIVLGVPLVASDAVNEVTDPVALYLSTYLSL